MKQKVTFILLVVALLAFFCVPLVATTVLDETFESGSALTIVNGSQVNQWVRNTATSQAGSYSLYITNNAAGTPPPNDFTVTSASIVHVYIDVALPAGETDIQLSFWLKGIGESTYDRLKVYDVATTQAITAGTALSTGQIGLVNYNAQGEWIRTGILLPSSEAGTTRRIVFSWANDSSGGTTPPIAIDNIKLITASISSLTGTYYIDSTVVTGGAYFNDFLDAILRLNCDGISGTTTFYVTSGQTYFNLLPAITATGTSSYSISFIKSGSLANPLIKTGGQSSTTTPADAGIAIAGGDYFTFDGIDIGTTTNATYQYVEYGYYLYNSSATNGAQNNTIKNCKVTLDRLNTSSIGIYQNTATTPTNQGTGNNNNNKYYNITVENSYTGIYLRGTSATYFDTGCEIGVVGSGTTTIGSTSANDIGNGSSAVYGIRASYQSGVKIFNSTLRNLTCTSNSTRTAGIFLENTYGTSSVYNNVIGPVTNLSTTVSNTTNYVVAGMRLDVAASSTVNVYNNFIYGISQAPSAATTATPSSYTQIAGIVMGVTAGTSNLYYNSIRLETNANINSACIVNTGSTANTMVFKNNVFANLTPTQTGTPKHYCVMRQGTSGTITTTNYNDYYIQNSGNGYVGYYAADKATLADWKGILTPNQDQQSKDVDPIFASATNLHSTSTGLNAAGVVISTTNGDAINVATDIDGDSRDTATPDMGADEFTPPSNPILSVTPSGTWNFGNLLINTSTTKQFTITNTGGGTLTISSVAVTGTHYSQVGTWSSTDLNSGQSVNFTVQYSPTSTVGSPHSGNVAITDNLSKNVTNITLTGSCYDPTIYSFPWNEKFNVTAGTLPNYWSVTEGTTGATYHWTASTGASAHGPAAPQEGTAFAWLYCFNASTTYNPYSLITPPISLDATPKWLKYYYWIGTDTYAQPLFVDVSTDNKVSWTPIYTHSNTSNTLNWYQNTINLSSYASGIIYLRFRGVSNYGNAMTDFGLDNFLIENLPATVEPSALTVTNITGSYVDLGWTENNTPAASQWDVIYGAPAFNPATDGQLVSGITANPYRLSGLSPSTSYSWYVRSITTGKAVSTWAGPGSFTTSQIPATLPLTETFETWPNGWTVLNGTQVNQWQVGTATFYEGAKSAYISNDGGTTNSYNNASTSVVHLYRDITFTADSQKFDLSFWWKGYGENASYDYLQVFLVDTSVLPVAGTRLLTGQIGSNYNLQNNWTQASIVIPGTNSGATKRLVLSWWNDSSGGTQPPIAVDDINLTATPNPINPEFSLTPTSKSFGDQQIGTSSAAQVFTIKNTGGGTLNITSPITIVDDDAAHFILTDANSYPYAGLGPNATMTVSVVFHPTTLGAKSARLKIVDDLASKGLMFVKQSSDGLRSDRYAALTGNGIDSTINSFPYTQDFEGSAFPPLGWVKTDLDGDGTNWVSSTAQNHTTSGTKSAYHIWSSSIPAPGQNGWLITPPIALPASGKYRISYWNYNAYPNDHEYAGLMVNTTDNASALGWVELWSPVTVTAAWSSQTVSLSTYAGQTIYLAFVYKGYNADGWYLDDVKIEEYFDYPAGEPVVVGTETITVTGGNANNSTGTIPDVPNASFVVAGSFNLTLIGAGPWTITIETDAPWGAYYQNGQWNSVQNVGGFITFILTANKDIAVPIVLGDSDPTLPVELSSFTATITTDLCVKIAWIAQSETNHSGYNVLRAEANDLSTAIKVNPVLIDNGIPLGTQLSYSYTDQEAYSNMVYYYWLESIALDGVSEFYGPLSVTIGDPSQDPLPPVIPMVTKLMNAFPNPFNPNTNLRYSLKEAGRVNISIYNVKGQLIKTYQNEHANPGYYQVSWDGKDQNGKPAASGIYMYRMVSGKYTDAKKMILAK